MPVDSPARDGTHPRDRSRARAWALQVLYRWESAGGGETITQALSKVLQSRRVAPRRLVYIELLLETLQDHLPEVDRVIKSALENWRLDRLSVMDRSILRLAATELLFLDDIPGKVSIQEGIHLAEAYGGKDSPRFVNGVLDALYKRSEPRG
ncbi:MAG: transcription antitermination factor NusB [Longimicrobiales bacterium]|nr:transcription antitermination factor NusB [Longimicrobiales bacterium]